MNTNSTTCAPKSGRSALDIVNARVQQLGLALALPTAPMQPRPMTSMPMTTTRASFYARKNGGGYRTARKDFTCEQFGCFARILAGSKYFDTMEVQTWPLTKRICACCAEKKV